MGCLTFALTFKLVALINEQELAETAEAYTLLDSADVCLL